MPLAMHGLWSEDSRFINKLHTKRPHNSLFELVIVYIIFIYK